MTESLEFYLRAVEMNSRTPGLVSALQRKKKRVAAAMSMRIHRVEGPSEPAFVEAPRPSEPPVLLFLFHTPLAEGGATSLGA